MIRLIQRHLIIPRGDTGTFSIPRLAQEPEDGSKTYIFTVFNPLERKKIFEKVMQSSDGMLKIDFTHADTVNLPVGEFVWDIKLYVNAVIVNDVFITGEEIDSYYAAFKLPVCEIRQTGDSLLTANDAPTTTINPEQLRALDYVALQCQSSEQSARESSESAQAAANTALESAQAAENSAAAAAETEQIVRDLIPTVPSKLSDLTDDMRLSERYIKPSTGIPPADLEETYLTQHQDISGKANVADLATVATSGSYTDLSDKPTNVSEFYNDEGYLTSFTETDPTVPAWAKQSTKPTYTAAEVGALPDTTHIPSTTQELTNNAGFITAAALPTKLGDLTNDLGYLTEHQDISSKADKRDTVLTTTLSRGRKSNTTIGVGSSAFGLNVTASGNYSHAEGGTTQSTGDYSHAEGESTQATGNDAHAEGRSTIASGIRTHAEGYQTAASASNAHAEGEYTHAEGSAAHAEGNSTLALGDYAHAEGSLTVAKLDAAHSEGRYTIAKAKYSHAEGDSTIASGESQHVSGKYNVEDLGVTDTKTYAVIVGNGTADNARSNAFALEWEGNARFAGDVFVNCNNDSSGGNKVYVKPVGGIPSTDLAETYLTSHQDISGKANSADLATVATSGSYNDLINKPTNVGAFTNDVGYLTSFTESDPTVPAWAKASTKPSYTAAEVGAPTVAEMNTAIGNAIGNINSFDIAVVQSLPSENISNHTIYFVPKTGVTNDVYDEYIRINNGWEMIGNTQIDLSNYVQKTDYATPDIAGLVRFNATSGFSIGARGAIFLDAATPEEVKAGTITYKSLTPYTANSTAFYGLAKAAGDTTQAASNNAIGTYTDSAKTAIRTMLGVAAASDIPNVPVTDIQVNGTSILSSGVANIPFASTTNVGVIKVSNAYGIIVNSLTGDITVNPANANLVKAGDDVYRPLTPIRQHESTYYGLSKAAGVDLANETVTVGTYPSQAKGAIQKMLGITDLFGNEENDITANKAYAIGEVFTSNGKLYRATTAIAQDGAIVTDGTGVNCAEINIANDYVKKTDYATSTTAGVVKINSTYGIVINDVNGNLTTYNASAATIKEGTNLYRPIAPSTVHAAAFYGLAKAAGADMAQSDNAIGTYTDTAKTAIRTMIGALGTNNIANSTTPGVMKVTTGGLGLVINSDNVLQVSPADSATIKAGTQGYRPITSQRQHESVFYGLTKAAGVDMASSDNAVGTYTDAAKTAIRTMIGAVGNTDYATYDTAGIVKVGEGLQIDSNQRVNIYKATDTQVKVGAASYRPITPGIQHTAVFYGLSKIAGVDLANETVTAGTYPAAAKTAIQNMLGINTGVAEESVTGTTVSITAIANTRYMCGTISSITITPCATGTCEFIFTSGTTAAVLTVPNTVKWPEWFDATALETNRIYDIIITNGVYGAVMSWPL